MIEKVARVHLLLRSKESSLFHESTKTDVPTPGQGTACAKTSEHLGCYVSNSLPSSSGAVGGVILLNPM